MTIKFNESNKKIAKKIQNLIFEELNKRLRNVAKKIEKDIVKENLLIWKQTPTYNSLINGKLTHEFGIPEGTAQQRVDTILDIFGRSISVIPKINYRKRSATNNYVILDINIFSKNIQESVFQMPESIVVTDKSAGNDYSNDFGAFGAQEIKKELPWLRWLLYEGNRYIIYGYEYQDIVSPNSRSGKGLMIRSESNWKVPAEFSGTKNSHWIIRALDDNRDHLLSEYTKIIERHI